MRFLDNKKLLVLSLFIILFILSITFYLYRGVLKSAEEIIEDNKNITQTAVKKLITRSKKDIIPTWKEYLKGKNKITKRDERFADSLLSIDVQDVLRNFHRLEGGFYFYHLDEFIGYSFPTIEDPKPAFGPPPRSYNIIREQARSTIKKDTLLTKLHKFDPAIFPLSTQPIYVDDELIGAAWARIHIERKLETSQNIQNGTFFLTVGSILLVLFIFILIVWMLRKRIREIKEGLSKMKSDPSHRLKEYRGAFGVISKAINEMTNAQQKEQLKREKLERELFQKEKMATLGNLIAGAAHEINTPISIIKTRIQIWERKLRKSTSNFDPITNESLEIVHNEIERVSKLIKRLLLFSKPLHNKKQKTNIHTLLEKKLAWVQEAYPTHEISFKKKWDNNLPSAYLDQESIQQVFANILKNAVEASPESCQIIVSTKFLKQEELVEIQIRDFGSGMSDKIKHKIFDPFFSTKSKGSGLGLSICNEIIKAHNGTIHFEKPKENNSVVDFWDQNTNITTIQKTLGTACVITLPISSETK